MISVWIVEDNPSMSQSFADLINSTEDMKCDHQFMSCEDALTFLEETINYPNVILMDIMLPGMNGIDGLSIIKEKYPQIDIIIETVFEDNDRIFKAICAGASGYLLKRSPSNQILDSIRDVIAGGSPINAHIAKKIISLYVLMENQENAYNLTGREKEILTLLVQGKKMKVISEMLHVSYFTVETHVKNIYSKLHVNSRSLAIAKAIKENLI
jgi:DNA-binding NarL/FixJ family response regulator